MFHTVLYTKAVGTLTLTKKLYLNRSPRKKKRRKQPGASQGPARVGRRRRRSSQVSRRASHDRYTPAKGIFLL